MSEVTKPIATDATLQSILTKQGQMVTALNTLANSSNNNVKISYGNVDLTDGVSTLPSGELYLYYN